MTGGVGVEQMTAGWGSKVGQTTGSGFEQLMEAGWEEGHSQSQNVGWWVGQVGQKDVGQVGQKVKGVDSYNFEIIEKTLFTEC